MLETPRLLLHPVDSPTLLREAFEVASLPELAAGMEFPAQFQWRHFQAAFLRAPRKDVFLLQDKKTGEWVGLVVFWAVPGRERWFQVLYGILEPHRGRGFAREACRNLFAQMARKGVAAGVLAIVRSDNLASLGVVRSMGMAHLSGRERTIWELPLGSFSPTFVERLWQTPRWEVMPSLLKRLASSMFGLLA